VRPTSGSPSVETCLRGLAPQGRLHGSRASPCCRFVNSVQSSCRQFMKPCTDYMRKQRAEGPNLVSRPRTAPKLVHKILFSMPPRTPPDKLLAAVRNFAPQEFADRHRYALALHTNEPHPHAHMVLKAMTEGWEYHLNIRKPMLPEWRKEFARQLCALGVPAKATRRTARRNMTKLTGIDRPVSRPSCPRHIEKRARHRVRVR
jgi:hypothetical protein